jgi:hypothetical protein
MYVCMYVCTYVQYQPEGWLDPHTVPSPDAHTLKHMHTHYSCMHTCPRTAHPIPPLRGVLRQELNRAGWPVPFPLRTAHNQATMKCITWLKYAIQIWYTSTTHKLTVIMNQSVSWWLEGRLVFTALFLHSQYAMRVLKAGTHEMTAAVWQRVFSLEWTLP